MVMRTSSSTGNSNSQIFHLNCFKCSCCDRHLQKGDEYLIKDEKIYCKYDYERTLMTQFMMTTDKSQSNNRLFTYQSTIEQQPSSNQQKFQMKYQLANNSNSSFNSNLSKFLAGLTDRLTSLLGLIIFSCH